ncbi:MAG: hypothetical protein IT337_09190 [Thermomicrobiales bacterium]|nr:hypothetical protein [Thermomicrobiales bacterium]
MSPQHLRPRFLVAAAVAAICLPGAFGAAGAQDEVWILPGETITVQNGPIAAEGLSGGIAIVDTGGPVEVRPAEVVTPVPAMPAVSTTASPQLSTVFGTFPSEVVVPVSDTVASILFPSSPSTP